MSVLPSNQSASDHAPLPLYTWQIAEASPTSKVIELAQAFDLLPPLIDVLLHRPFLQGAGAEELDRFLNPSLLHLTAPKGLPGIEEATEILWEAIHQKKSIVIFGDFDADGICATSILTRILNDLHAKVRPFIPERLTEGYGLTIPAINRCLEEGVPDLLITVDCGINSVEEVEYLKRQGVRVIITDHHTPGRELPAADYVIDPILPGTDPALQPLCGAGVAFKLVQSLILKGKEEGWYRGEKVLPLILSEVAIATIADVVPLIGENHTLVANALLRWGKTPPPIWIQELLRAVSSKAFRELSEDQVSFLIAPHINASGRMGSPKVAFDLLCSETQDEAQQLAVRLKSLNTERKQTEAAVLAESLQQIQGSTSVSSGSEFATSSPEAIVVAGPKKRGGKWAWHPGVIGIVAARLSDRFGRPAAVLSLEEGDPSVAEGHGSIRAAPGYNVKIALDACASVLSSYGGHPGAAGFSVKPGCLEQFKVMFSAACASQRQHISTDLSTLQIDYWISPQEITLELYEQSRRLGPFGCENPKIHWGIRGVEINRISILGANNALFDRPTHLSLLCDLEGFPLPRAIWFRQGEKEPLLTEWFKQKKKIDIAFELSKNDYGQTPSVEMIITDIRLSDVV